MLTPKKFKEANVTFGEGQPEYLPLPAFKNESPNGEVFTCWGLSWKDRLRALFYGEIWLSLYTFNGPLTPSLLASSKWELFQKPQSKLSRNWHKFRRWVQAKVGFKIYGSSTYSMVGKSWGWKYRLMNPFRFQRLWSGQLIYFTFFVEWSIIIDTRRGTLVDQLLTPKEKVGFWLRWNLLNRKN